MKPVELKLKNIGPYLNETIDFTKLENIFLIAGNTGAGKSFIFDAMTYALYGQLRGNRKGLEKDLKSRYSGDSIEECSVEFTFRIGENLYRVKRHVPFIPAGNKSEKNPHPDLSIKKPGKTEFETCTENNRIETVNSEIQKIIGLNVDEFSKVILLPQGAFAEFLKQNSTKRQETLEKLFPVEDYRKIMDVVLKKVKVYLDEKKDCEAVVTEEKKSLSGMNVDFDNIEQELEKLESEKNSLEDERNALVERSKTLASEKTSLEQNLKTAEENENNLRRKAELDKDKARIEALEKTDSMAEKANALSDVIKNEKRCSIAEKNSAEELTEAKKVYSESVKEFDLLNSRCQEMEALAVQNEKDKTELDGLNDKISKIEDYEKAAGAEEQFKSKRDKLEKNLTDLKKQLEEIKKPLEGREIDGCISETKDEIRKLSDEKNKSESLKKDCEERDRLSAEKTEIEKALDKCRQEFDAAQTKLTQAENTLNQKKSELEARKTREAAFNLARFLKKGEACPVCGSIEHPKPAESMGDFLSLEDEVKVFEEALGKFQKEFREKTSALSAENTKASENARNLEKYAGLGTTASVAEELQKAGESLKAAEKRDGELKQLQDSISECEEKINGASDEFQAADSDWKAASATRITLEKDIGSDTEALKTRQKEILEIYTRNAGAFKKWKEKLHNAETVKSGALSARNEKQNNSDKAVLEHKSALEKLESAVSASVFKTREEAEECMLNPEVLEENRRICSRYRQDVAAVNEALKNAGKTKASAEIRTELQAVDVKISENDGMVLENQKVLSETNRRQTLLSTCCEKIKDGQKKLSEMEEKSKPLLKLKEHLEGGAAKIAFNTWALGLYFEQVVEFASERFFEISNHRFEFKFRDTADRDGNSKMGLDLQIIDHNIADCKPADTSTLSGGETFEASISLALAITDVVQNNNGGISLDSLFIDEGFGTLDPEPLESTMRVLNELSETKMIGIISHVESLKEGDETGITSKILVRDSKNGSVVEIP